VKAPLNADGRPIATDTLPPALLYWGTQPGLMLFVFAAGAGILPGLSIYAALLISFVALTLAERAWPARREWTQSWREWGQVLAMFAINSGAMALIEYGLAFAPVTPFASLHAFTASIWPTPAPLLVQVLLAFAAMQFIAYWSHRWQHEIGFLWRMFGHGTHHTYTKLSAINWNTTHPFEAFLLVMPIAILGLLFGLSEVAIIAGGMIMVTTACAHTNMRMNERIIGLVFTTNSQHMHHHSAVFAESNTNYGCAMTIWDRVFGTFAAGDTKALGDSMEGERTLWRRLTVPLKGD
jgi:sterol desaturase/sphingolipid hydroxylase (fatty acid hydroxylase superfamily)